MLDTTPVQQFGVHVTLDCYGADPERLADQAGLRAFLTDLPRRMGMHPITEAQVVAVGPNNKKDPGGISGFIMIAESHLSVHTFPRRGFLSADVYTCQEWIDDAYLIAAFREAFGVAEVESRVIPRGTRYPVHDLV